MLCKVKEGALLLIFLIWLWANYVRWDFFFFLEIVSPIIDLVECWVKEKSWIRKGGLWTLDASHDLLECGLRAYLMFSWAVYILHLSIWNFILVHINTWNQLCMTNFSMHKLRTFSFTLDFYTFASLVAIN